MKHDKAQKWPKCIMMSSVFFLAVVFTACNATDDQQDSSFDYDITITTENDIIRETNPVEDNPSSKDDHSIRDNPSFEVNEDIRSTGQWYKGDLHVHSKFSGNDDFPNGSEMDNGDRTVGELLEIVGNKGFDFITISDHDFLPDFVMFDIEANENAYPPHWTDPEYESDEIVLLYGMEYTAIGGHANIWAAQIYDYGKIWETHNFVFDSLTGLFFTFLWSMAMWTDAVDASHEQGALFSINHPSSGWLSTMPEDFDTMEVWNGTFYLETINRISINSYWHKYLSQGKRVSGVGGSDKHRFDDDPEKNHDVGQPTTWVFSAEKNAESILGAIKAGRVSISYTSEAGYLEFFADADNNGVADVMMGDNIVVEGATDIDFTLRHAELGASDIEGTIVELPYDAIDSIASGIDALDQYVEFKRDPDTKIICLYKNGKRHRVWILKDSANIVEFSETVNADERIFYRAEIFGDTNWSPKLQIKGGDIMGLTNPIYVNY